MEVLIKTENVAQFINDYFVGSRDPFRDGGGRANVEHETKDEVFVSKNKGGLKDGDVLILEYTTPHNKRCDVRERFVYLILDHDSVSFKGLLSDYSSFTTTTTPPQR